MITQAITTTTQRITPHPYTLRHTTCDHTGHYSNSRRITPHNASPLGSHSLSLPYLKLDCRLHRIPSDRRQRRAAGAWHHLRALHNTPCLAAHWLNGEPGYAPRRADKGRDARSHLSLSITHLKRHVPTALTASKCDGLSIWYLC